MRILFVGVLGLLAGALLAAPAAAAPDNKNTATFSVDCGEAGQFEVTENVRGGENSGGVVFGPDGQVFVAKGFSDTTFQHSLAIDGGPTINFPPDSFDQEPRGNGYQDRLIGCEFTQTFTETFELTARDVAHLEAFLASQGTPQQLDAFVGAEATSTGTASGTAHVLIVGQK